MAVKVKTDAKGFAGTWLFANHAGKRRSMFCGSGKNAEKDARQLAAEWQSKITLGRADEIFDKKRGAPVVDPRGAVTLRDAVESYIARREAANEVRGGTPAAWRSRCRRWLYPTLGDTPINEVTRELLGEVVTAIKAAGRSKTCVAHVVGPVRLMFEDLRERKVIAENPAADLKHFIGKMPRAKSVEVFTQAECAQLLRAAEGTPLEMIVATALGTGMRFGELAALTRDDVDLERGRIHVVASWSRKAGKVQTTKTGRSRTVPLVGPLLERLRVHVEARTAEGWRPRQLMFPGQDGTHRHEGHHSVAWRRLLERAGLPRRVFHTCRHSFASHALRAGVRPELLQKWLGHSTLTMTLNVYGHFLPDHAGDQADAEKLGRLLEC